MSKQKNALRLLKGVVWLFVSAASIFAVVYYFTQDPGIAARISAAAIAIQAFCYWLLERAWDHARPSVFAARPFVLWLTGLSGSGKSALADAVFGEVRRKGYRTVRLDGDSVRAVFPNTGFTRDERNAHIRRVGYMASILEHNGIIVICSFVSPYAESRDFVRGLCDNFIEVFVDTPLAECERRDVKGLYKKARSGAINNFTGIDDPYEPPGNPELVIRTENRSVDESAAEILSHINQYL